MTTTLSSTRPTDHYRLADVVRSEWTKVSSVRSLRWTLAAFAVVTVALGVLVSALSGSHWLHQSAQGRAGWDPTNMSLAGFGFGDLALPVVAVLMMTGEYSSGSIRSTLCAVPRRWVLLAAKSIVFVTMALVVGETVSFATFLAGQAALGGAPHASLGDPSVLRAVALSGAFVALMGLFGLGLGAIIRHSAGAVAAFAGLVLFLPAALSPIPGHVARFSPEVIISSSVGAVLVQPHQLSPWVGFAVMAIYAVVAVLVGGAVLARRDA